MTRENSTLKIDTPEWALPLFAPARYKGAWGGRGCVHPDTLIETPIGKVKVKDFTGGNVYSWEDGRLVVAQATSAFPCTEEDLFEVVLCDGSSIVVTDEHKFLTPTGWKMLSSLCSGDDVLSLPQQSLPYLPQTTVGTSPQELQTSVQHLMQTHEDCQDDCLECCHQYDRQLLSVKDNALFLPQQQADEQQHSFRVLSHEDGRGCAGKCIPSSSSAHASSRAAPPELEQQYCEDLGSCNGEKSSAPPSRKCQSYRQSLGYTVLGVATPKIAKHYPASCIQKDQVQIHPEHHCKPSRTVYDTIPLDQSCLSHSECVDFHYKQIRLIRHHSRQTYWDLHVFKTNNYIAQGFVNHNSGKSHFFAEMLIEAHILNQNESSVCIREVQKSLNQSVKRLLEQKIEDMNAGDYFEVQETCIKSRHGNGLIIFQGMQNHTADTIKSLQGYKRAWVEEAQSLSQRSLDLLRPTIREEGSELWFTWNPNDRNDPVDLLLRGDSPPPDSIIIPVNYDDNPWFPDVLRAEMEYDRSRDIDRYNHVWLGHYRTASEARVFKNWTIQEFERPEGTVYRLGADWGFSVDPSVMVRCSLDGNRLYIDHEAYMIGCEITGLPDLFDRVPESRKWFCRADSARPEVIDYMRKHGYPKMQAAQKGAGSIETGIQFLQSYDIVVHPRCKHVIDELNTYSYKRDPKTDEILPQFEDKNNHLIDALRYACEGVRKTEFQQKAKVELIPTKHNWR